MTAKEKAEELVEKFTFASIYFFDKENGAKLNAKQCTLVAVDEILNVLPHQEYLEDIGKFIENRERIYWKEVKQEIEKL